MEIAQLENDRAKTTVELAALMLKSIWLTGWIDGMGFNLPSALNRLCRLCLNSKL